MRHASTVTMWRKIIFSIFRDTLLYTGIQLILAALVIVFLVKVGKVESKDGWGHNPSDWDTIVLGITLLLATYLPLELSKYNEVLSAFHKITQRSREVLRYNTSNLKELEKLIENCNSDGNPVIKTQDNLKNIFAKLNSESDTQMDRFTELVDSIVDLHNKQTYIVPTIYQNVLIFVLIIFFGVIMPYSKCNPPHAWHALIDVFLVGFLNNLILSSGKTIGNTMIIRGYRVKEPLVLVDTMSKAYSITQFRF